MEKDDEILKKPKLIWSGTRAEAIAQGRNTQEEFDEWDRIDEEGEKYNEGYIDGQQSGQKRILELIDKWYYNDFFRSNIKLDFLKKSISGGKGE